MIRGLILGVAFAITALSAYPLEREVTEIGGTELVVYRHTLDNGLTVLLMENHTAPTVGLCTTFRVGSVDEWDGVSGATHILEHMLFKGSKNIGTSDWFSEEPLLEQIEEIRTRIRERERGGTEGDDGELARLREEWKSVREKASALAQSEEIGRIYTENGARGLNAMTSYDFTSYIVSLPVNRLELWMLIESERLRGPVLREFYTEIENIREERRMGVEDQAEGKLWEIAAATAFQAHRYGVEIIGWDSDLQSINRTEVENYFKLHYAPNRMIISVVGDIDPGRTVEMIEAYFGDFKRMADPHPVETVEPEQKGERRVEVEFDSEPLLFIGYHKPTAGHPDDPPLLLTNVILNRGRSSRLNRNVIEKKIASSIRSGTEDPGERYPNLFYFGLEVQAPNSVKDAEEAIYTELDRLKEEPVSDAELARAQSYIETNYVREFTRNLDAAIKLGIDEAMLGNWMERTAGIAACRDVTADDIQRVAESTFRKGNRTVAYLVRPEKADGEEIMEEQ